MSEVEKDENLDYSLTLNALYTAFYLKENPYVDSKESAFVLSKKPSSTFRDRLLEKAEDKKTPIFARPSDYSTILSTYYSGMPKKTASSNSGSHRTFLVTHLGGWRSGKTDLANVTDPIFHDNGRSSGSVREEFCEELLNWKYSRDEKGSCRFLKNGESMGNPLSAGSRPLSEYIVECNYTLISNFYVRKSVLRQVIIDFASNMHKAEEVRRDNGQNDLVSDPENKEGVKELCECLNKIMEAYDQLPETESQREWLISRAFTWLVIAAFLREYLTPYVIEQCMKEYMFNTYQPGMAEDITEQKEKGAGKVATVSVPELFWRAGKNWYDEARKPGARFHSLDIVDHILPDASDKPIHSGSEHDFPFRASDKEEHTIQCSRFSELLRDRNSIYHQGHFMLIGEGGIGKTTTLMSAMYDAYEDRENYNGVSVIPLFLELSQAPDSQESPAYDGISSSVIHRQIYSMLKQRGCKKNRSDLLRECMNEKGTVAKDTVREYFSSNMDGEIRYALLIDGLNEVSAEPFTGHRSSSAQARILQEITEMIREYHNISIILTGRNNAFNDHPSIHTLYLRTLAREEIEDYLCEKGKTDDEIDTIIRGEKGLLEVLSIPMFLTMFVLLNDTENITTRGELMKVFFHERFERRKKEYAIYRQGDVAERVDRDEEQSISGRMARGKITIPLQWLFLDILIPEVAAKMESLHAFQISEKEVRALLEALFTDQNSLYCGRYKEFSNSCFENQQEGEYLEDVISDFTGEYHNKIARYSAAFLKYCESSMGIFYKEGGKNYGFIHQHFRDYFASVCIINRMKIAYTAFLDDGPNPAREIMKPYEKEAIAPVLMTFIGEYLGEHHNAPIISGDKETSPELVPTVVTIQERRLISNLFDIYRGIKQDNVLSVYNLLEIIKRTRKDLSGSDLHDLDLQQCRFYDIYLDSRPGISLKGAIINAGNWFGEGHYDLVNTACFNRDGSLVVTASRDHSARIWDSRTGRLLHVLKGHTKEVNTACFNRDGSLVVTASWDNTARIWDSRTGRLLHVLKGHTEWPSFACFSRDGSQVVTASWDNTARIWDSHTGRLLHVLKGHTGEVNTACFSSDGSLIVTASRDYSARVWDSRTGKMLHILTGHTGWLSSACFSSDGSLIVTASWDNTARIWDSRSGRLLHVLAGHTEEVNSACFNSDGSQVVTASFDYTACIWDSCSGNLLHVLEGHIGEVNSASFSSDGSQVVTASWDKTARIWDSSNGRLVHVLEGHSREVNNACFSSNGNMIVTASFDHTVRIWSSRSGMPVHVLEGHTGWLKSACFSSDGSQVIITASWDEAPHIWDSRTGRLVHSDEGHTKTVNSVSFNSDGKQDDMIARISGSWSYSSPRLLQVLTGHTGAVNSVSFNNDGSQVVTSSDDNTARILDMSSGRIMVQVLTGHTGAVNSASFNSDGSQVVTSSDDNTARIWDMSSGRIVQVLTGHTGAVNDASFSSDGSQVVTVSDDNTARIWDVKSGNAIRILYEVEGLHINGVNFKDISPKSKMTDKQKEVFRQYGAIV